MSSRRGPAAEMQKVSIVESPPIASVTSNHQSVDKRIQNRSASLGRYAAARAQLDPDDNAAWSTRVSRKHQISSSSSPDVRRSHRTPKKAVRFVPGNADHSPYSDDSGSYSDGELQNALQQKGIPTLISRRPAAKRNKKSAGFIPPIPRAKLLPSQWLPSSKQAMLEAKGRTRQTFLSKNGPLVGPKFVRPRKKPEHSNSSSPKSARSKKRSKQDK